MDLAPLLAAFVTPADGFQPAVGAFQPRHLGIGQNLDIIIPESLREAHWTGYRRALAAGDTKYRGQSLPTKALKADGATIYVELGFSIVHAADGTVVGAMAQARDITERFERDRTTRRRMRELEAALEAKPSA